MQIKFVRPFIIYFLLICATVSGAAAQAIYKNEVKAVQIDTLKSRKLDSIKIKGASSARSQTNYKFSVGTNLIRFTEEKLSSMKMASLSDFIRQESAAYIKEYGKGMNAYISVRGSSSSHTTVAWNGMNLAVPTMGQTDFSHIPLYLFDGMEMHVGGSSALYGDGAIGGSIRLSTAPKWEKGFHGDILLSAGSFASYFTGGTLRYSNGKFETRTSLLCSEAKNDYKFINNTKIGKPEERLNNAAGNNAGLLQEFFRKFKDSSVISATLLFMDFDKQIQPSVSLNDNQESYRSIYDENLKANLGYNSREGELSYGARISYAYDKQLYEDDIIAANRLSLSADAERKFKNLTIKCGVYAEHTIPQVNSYADSVRESRYNVFVLARYSLNNRLLVSGGVRYAGATDFFVPLMPSLEAKYNLINRNNISLSLRGAFSGNSKIPSLNDRYWGGDYMYLKSESSKTIEGGLDYSWFSERYTIDFFCTLYKSRVNDWIRWLPAGTVWRPQNIPLVVTQGAEAGVKLSGGFSRTKFSLNFSMAYTDIKMKEGLRVEDPAIGHQLAYQPKISWRSGLRIIISGVSMYCNLTYTGERSTLDIFDILPSYLLTDLGASYDFKISGARFAINGVIKNITNEMYQNVKFYAMPGRNCQISIQYKF
ncbi:MAG: TonB-dependent receptor [Bacteroidales bacterium]|nr:TonB-dependent receptor [Bacteroidales bacterium]